MLKLTWTAPCSSRRSYPFGIHRELPASHVSTLSRRGLNANQLGLLLSLKNRSNAKMDSIVRNSVEPGTSGGGAPWNSWQGLIFGVVVSLILPFWRGKWGPFLAIKKRVDAIVDSVEDVAEVVEQVAEKVEDIADEIGEKLPEGKLKGAFNFIEELAKETAKDAHLVDEFIEKVEDVEEKVEEVDEKVESLLERPVVEDQAEKEETKNVDDKPNTPDNT